MVSVHVRILTHGKIKLRLQHSVEAKRVRAQDRAVETKLRDRTAAGGAAAEDPAGSVIVE